MSPKILKYFSPSLVPSSVLQSLIPDIKVNQDVVMELHSEELQMSGDEENLDSGQDKGLKIRRTVTQVGGGGGGGGGGASCHCCRMKTS